MRFATVGFRFGDIPHFANVYVCEALDYYTVYFEEIDLFSNLKVKRSTTSYKVCSCLEQEKMLRR